MRSGRSGGLSSYTRGGLAAQSYGLSNMTNKNGKVSRIGQDIEQLSQLQLQQSDSVTSLCLHGNCLKDLQGLKAFCALESLNLSSNCLEGRHLQQGLTSLTRLTDLNLASNRISCLGELPALSSLKVLNLGHNFLSSLKDFGFSNAGHCSHSQAAAAGTKAGSQQHQALFSLDIRDNLLPGVHELQQLQGLSNLRQLYLKGGAPGNALCARPGYRLAVASILPQLELLDGQDLINERLQLARDPQAASSFIAEAADQYAPGIPAEASLRDATSDALPAAQTPDLPSQANELPTGSFMAALGTAQPQLLGPAVSGPVHPVMQGNTWTATGLESLTGSAPWCSPGMWNAAWQHTNLSGHPVAHAVSSRHLPYCTTTGQHHMQQMDNNKTAAQPRQVPSSPAVDLEKAASFPDVRSPPEGSASAEVRNNISRTPGTSSNSMQHYALLSMFDAHLQQLLEQQTQSNDRATLVKDDNATRQQGSSSQISPGTAPRQGSQFTPKPPDNGGQGCVSTNTEASHAAGTMASGRGQDPIAKVDAACQAGEGGKAMDRLRQDADRYIANLPPAAILLPLAMNSANTPQAFSMSTVPRHIVNGWAGPRLFCQLVPRIGRRNVILLSCSGVMLS